MKVALVVLAALAFGACDTHEGPQVAFLLSTLRGDRYAKDIKFFAQRADELGLRVITRAADDDAAKQLAQVEQVLALGVKVLVVQPADSTAAARYVQLAHERGARVIAYDRAIVAPDLDYYVSHDSYLVGVLQAQAALEATHGKGNYVLLAGQSGQSVETDITRGYKDTLAPYLARGEVQIVLDQNHRASSAEQARRTVETALARSDGRIDAILADSSSLARGAVEAIAVAGKHPVFIAGADADAANVNLICQGRQAVEVRKDIQALARAAADTAKQLLDGEMPAATVAAIRVELVTPDNVKSMLVDSGFFTVDELPACKHRLAGR